MAPVGRRHHSAELSLGSRAGDKKSTVDSLEELERQNGAHDARERLYHHLVLLYVKI